VNNLANLVIFDFNVPSTATIGSTINVSMRVANFGTRPSGAFRVGFYWSTDGIITTSDLPANAVCNYPTGVAPQEFVPFCNVSIIVPTSLPPGFSYGLGVLADDLNAVVESEESDNDYGELIQLVAPIQLSLTQGPRSPQRSSDELRGLPRNPSDQSAASPLLRYGRN
jgi:subtilase family serine protease